MKESVKKEVRQILDNYLETSHRRKTPERYAILDTAYSIGGHFTLEQLETHLAEQKFFVCRATLYNTLRLFIKLRLIVRHRLLDGTKYEACYANSNHCHQVCTVCGKVTEIIAPDIIKAVDAARLKRFRKDGFSLYIYGICSACQSKMMRKKTV